MEAIEAQGVRKARGYSRLVKEKLPPNYNQTFQMILILKMKKMCQNRKSDKKNNADMKIINSWRDEFDDGLDSDLIGDDGDCSYV